SVQLPLRRRRWGLRQDRTKVHRRFGTELRWTRPQRYGWKRRCAVDHPRDSAESSGRADAQIKGRYLQLLFAWALFQQGHGAGNGHQGSFHGAEDGQVRDSVCGAVRTASLQYEVIYAGSNRRRVRRAHRVDWKPVSGAVYRTPAAVSVIALRDHWEVGNGNSWSRSRRGPPSRAAVRIRPEVHIQHRS